MSDDDILGGEAPDSTDDGLGDGPGTATGVVEEFNEGLDPAPADDGPKIPEWAGSLPEEVRGFVREGESLEDFVERSRGMQQRASRAEQRAAEAEKQMDALLELPADEPSGNSESPDEALTDHLKEIGDAFDTGRITLADALTAATRAQRAVSRVETEAIVREKTEPIERDNRQNAVEKELTGLLETHGQEAFDELSPKVVDLVKREPELYANPKGVRAAWGLAMAEQQAAAAAAERERTRSETPDPRRANHAEQVEATVAKLQSDGMKAIFSAGDRPAASNDGL